MEWKQGSRALFFRLSLPPSPAVGAVEREVRWVLLLLDVDEPEQAVPSIFRKLFVNPYFGSSGRVKDR